jgi:hypothetical protein
MNQNNAFRWLLLAAAVFSAWQLWKKYKQTRGNSAAPTGSIGSAVDPSAQNLGAPALVAAAGTSPFAAGGLTLNNSTNIGVSR